MIDQNKLKICRPSVIIVKISILKTAVTLSIFKLYSNSLKYSTELFVLVAKN